MSIADARTNDARDFSRLLKCGASATAICAFALSTPAFAQTVGNAVKPAASTNASGDATTLTADSPQSQATSAATDPTQTTDEPAANEVVVTGIRASLANAQNIKRNADTVVDAITAQDIGALPDRSVTEALQRVPGVAINRFAGSNDPDHFSVEGSGVVVRGLNFVRSEFNGRDTFSSGIGGQAINFADVPSELLGSVEVYKNATADLIEGGLAGTVNLNTRKPFDNRGFHIGGGVEGNYGDFRKKWSPTASLLVSNTFDTDIGTFGFLGNLSYSRIKSRADGLQITNFQTRDNRLAPTANGGAIGCRNGLPSGLNTTTLPANGTPCGTASTPGADGFSDLRALSYAPIGGQFRSQDFDRKRDGQALAVQWESNDKRTLFTAQFLRTHSTNAWGEHTFESAPDLSEYNTYPAGCQQNGNGPGGTVRAECPTGTLRNYTYDADGLFESGYITLPGSGWRSASSGSATTTVPTGGVQQSMSRRQVFDENLVKDAGFNLKLNPTDKLSINLDVDYTYAQHDVVDLSLFGSTFADSEIDLTGKLPVVIPHKPLTLAASWAAPNVALNSATDQHYFQSRTFQFWRAAMDHIEHSSGSEYQIKGDFAYKFDEGSFLTKAKFGARYAERQQTVRYSSYNWGAISEIWSGAPVTFAQGDQSKSEYYAFPDFFRGQTPGPTGAYFYNGDLTGNYNQAVNDIRSFSNIWVTTNAANSFRRPDTSTFSASVPTCNASTVAVDPRDTTGATKVVGCTPTNTFVPAAGRAGAIPGSQFLPEEIQPVNQQDSSAYFMLNFGSETPIFGDVRVSGNVGVRYVNSALTSAGRIGVPTQQALGVVSPFDVRCAPRVPEGAPPGTPAASPGGICNLGPAVYAQIQQFATGLSVSDVARTSYDYWLPSANVKFGLSNDLILRFAGSKVLTRPDLANIRNFIQVSTDPNSGIATATAGNPYLKPATAWQFDATIEWYFARVGSLTFDAFYKSVNDFFFSSLITRNITSNGITVPVLIRGPANYDKAGKIKGFEVAYQQTFDFLPGFLNGLGFSGNYSYIDSKGLPNSFLNGGSPSNTSTITPGNLPLEGLSKHNVNASLFYEKGPISIRTAYNWRSRFLLTAADVIFPYTSIYNEATGQLDASVFVNVSKNIKFGVQGVNLTNEVTKTLQAYSGDGNRLAPRSYFMNDRRFSFILRGNY